MIESLTASGGKHLFSIWCKLLSILSIHSIFKKLCSALKHQQKGSWLLVEKLEPLRAALPENSHHPASNDSGKALYHCGQTQSYNLLSIHIVSMPRKFVLLCFLDPFQIYPPPVSKHCLRRA